MNNLNPTVTQILRCDLWLASGYTDDLVSLDPAV